jgi:hypothetical protein
VHTEEITKSTLETEVSVNNEKVDNSIQKIDEAKNDQEEGMKNYTHIEENSNSIDQLKSEDTIHFSPRKQIY